MQSLKNLLGKTLDLVFIDGQYLDINSTIGYRSNKCIVIFSDGYKLNIDADIDPHYWGDGELNFTLKRDDVEKIEVHQNKLTPITRIRLWKWKENGISIFNAGEVCQITFYSDTLVLCTLGMITLIRNNTDRLSIGEITLGNDERFESNAAGPLLYVDIT